MSRYIKKSYSPEAHQRDVFRRGSGSITVIYPDVAQPDKVSKEWLKEHRPNLPPGTIIRQDGVTFRIEEQP